jgi:signal peptide peptidase SppA
MRLQQILTTLTSEPLLMTPQAVVGLLELFKDHAAMVRADFKALREGVDYCGEAIEIPQAEMIDGVMHIPIGGPIGRGLGKFEKGAGAVDTQDLADEIDVAEDDSMVRAILFDIDSPGGMLQGTPELADRIARCQKPTIAFSAGQMCSAAYWIGCACDYLYATRSADIGSIGVYVPFLDQSAALKAMGLEVQVFSSGKFKGMGVPGTALSKDQKEFMLARVGEIARLFQSHVSTNRPDSSEDDMQGQVFLAEAALSKGLVDAVVADKAEALEMF